MQRPEMLQRAESHIGPWDILIIGGGATGAGVALDAASRGYSTLLLEQHDFGKGTSSRSTKLIHGGVRYLEQGNIPLVIEALKERGILRRNAPHLVHELPFVVPTYSWWEGPFYGIGLKLYQILSGKYGFGPSQLISKEETLSRLPNLNPQGLTGGVIYYDGQFDDTRLLINLIATAAEHGATVLNYAKVTALHKDPVGIIDRVEWQDIETGATFNASAKVVINAAGPFADSIRHLADPEAKPIIAPSQGAHIVLDRSFLPGNTAIMVPHTSDGRVMFAIPWHRHTLVGTTDTPITETPLEPIPFEAEIQFILETAALYLHRKPTRADILTQFAGIRPLAKSGHTAHTAALSRGHTIQIDHSGLLTIAGGKWTTYRNMAEDCVNHAATLANLPDQPCLTKTLPIHGHHLEPETFGPLSHYGADAPAIQSLIANAPLGRAKRSEAPTLAQPLDPALPYTPAEVLWAVRHEMARTVEDILARRTRALFLNARAALRMAPAVAALLARELNRDDAWQRTQIQSFTQLAAGYLPPGLE